MINKYFKQEDDGSPPFLAMPNLFNPRIILPLKSGNAFRSSLSIHNTASPKNRFIKKALSISYCCIKKKKGNYLFLTPEIKSLLKTILKKYPDDLDFSFYLGTEGAKNRKLTIQVAEPDKIITYIKVAADEDSKKYLRRESIILQQLSNQNFTSYIVPKIVDGGELNDIYYCLCTNAFAVSKQTGYNLDDFICNNFISFLNDRATIGDLRKYYERLERILSSAELNDNVKHFVESSFNRLKNLSFFSILNHGDFTPYNIKISGDKLAAVDWEFAEENGQPFYDIFHFVYQGKYQILRKKPDYLINDIMSNSNNNRIILKIFAELKIPSEYLIDFFALYLFEELVKQLNLRIGLRFEQCHFYQGLKILLNKKQPV